MRIEFQGNLPTFRMISSECHQQFSDIIPHQVDRYADFFGFGKLSLTGFSQEKATEKNKMRKKRFMKLLSLNSSSRYIPTFIDNLEKISSNWHKGQTYGMVKEMNYFTFTVFAHILFGKDLEHIVMREVEYINNSNEIIKTPFRDFFVLLLKDLAYGWVHPLTLICPSLNKYDLINPFKRNIKNIKIFWEVLKDLMSKCKDKDSIYCQLMADEETTESDAFEDIITFLIGGTETSSHSITSTLYYLYKNPAKKEILIKEFEENGFGKGHSGEKYTIDNIHKMDYLNFVVKESLRMDSPGPEALQYQAVQDVMI